MPVPSLDPYWLCIQERGPLQALEQRLQRMFRLDPRGTFRDVKEFHDSGIEE
jgi:hypothetical protein